MRVAAVHAAVGVDQAGRVLCLDRVGDRAGLGPVPLAPALVERHPDGDRGEALVFLDHLVQLGLELGAPRLGHRIGLRRRHVLPDHQAEFVGPVVPAVRLDLDVLADGVEAEALVLIEVEAERRVGRRCVQSVRPEALVEGGQVEQDLPVQRHPKLAVGPFLQSDRAHPGVRTDLVYHFAAVEQLDLEVVQERIVGRPGLRVRDLQPEFGVRLAFHLADLPASVVRRDLDVEVRRSGGLCGDLEGLVRQVRRELEAADRGDVHRLHPDGPPDAGTALVEDAVVADLTLLADRLVGLVGEVLRPDDQLLRALRVQGVGDVDVEAVVPAAVRGDLAPVHPDLRVVVDRTEVQHEPLALPVVGDLEGTAVPHAVLVLLQTGEGGLDRVRDEHLLIERASERGLLVYCSGRPLPEAVEVAPFRAGQLRAWVLRERVRGRDVVGPRGGEGRCTNVPVGCCLSRRDQDG